MFCGRKRLLQYLGRFVLTTPHPVTSCLTKHTASLPNGHTYSFRTVKLYSGVGAQTSFARTYTQPHPRSRSPSPTRATSSSTQATTGSNTREWSMPGPTPGTGAAASAGGDSFAVLASLARVAPWCSEARRWLTQPNLSRTLSRSSSLALLLPHRLRRIRVHLLRSSMQHSWRH